MPGGAGEVEPAVYGHVAAPVALAGQPPHGVEGRGGQRRHRGEVLGHRLRDGPAVAAAGRGVGVDAGAAGREPGVELGERGRLGHRDQQVPPQEAHGVLDGPLLVARVRVAVPARAAVVRAEPREEVRLRDDPAEPSARLGGVVEHERRRGAADLLEDLAEPVAQALGALGHPRDAEPRVGVGEREDQQLERDAPPRQHGLEVPVVGLRGPRGPLQLEEPVPGRRPPAPPLRHVAAHARVGPLVAALGDHPVVDAPCGVALLARGTQVACEHRVDPLLVARERGPRPRGRERRRRRHVLHVGVLGHGVATHAELAGDPGPGDAPRVHLAYIMLGLQGHGHPLLLPGVVSPKVPPWKDCLVRPVSLRPARAALRTLVSSRCARCSVFRANCAQLLLNTNSVCGLERCGLCSFPRAASGS